MLTDFYHLQPSNRKSITASYNAQGDLIIKAPLGYPTDKIDQFLAKNSGALWHLKQKTQKKTYFKKEIFKESFKKFQAIKVIQERFAVMHQKATLLDIKTNQPIAIKIMTSRWGSCKNNGVICLNLFLGLLPIPLIDAVIAHELCHLQEMNHSKRFYALLDILYPSHRKCDQDLRQYVLCR
ncbi:MAG: putative metal-dependent hydrolase [Alphaproteobacteria bacterium]|jgi:predicted metal-dependent hydrolase